VREEEKCVGVVVVVFVASAGAGGSLTPLLSPASLLE
jgi:hypothetical protein